MKRKKLKEQLFYLIDWVWSLAPIMVVMISFILLSRGVKAGPLDNSGNPATGNHSAFQVIDVPRGRSVNRESSASPLVKRSDTFGEG